MALKRIGDILVQENILTREQLQTALLKKEKDERLGETLVRLGFTSEAQILKALETSTGVRRVSLANFKIDEEVLTMVDEEFCRRHTIIPLRIEGGKLYFATDDPLDFDVFEELRILTGFSPKAYSSTKNEIIAQIEKYYGFTRTLEAMGIKQNVAREEIDAETAPEDTPMVALVNQILASAVFQRASDIHIDPMDDKIVIRYRVDGVLDTVREFPIHILRQMVSRIKVMSGMDITETRIPQDGRIQTPIQQRIIDLRISTLPTVRGEKVVIRILNPATALNSIHSLNLGSRDERLVREMIAKQNGIVLVSGPTGSGKTTTLYACLAELNSPGVNIVTVEDPVEIKMAGVNQVQVHPEVELTFAKALRSILRQDPNIVMIGEIRDVETAEIAIRASLTGHLVLSTIHTNDAVKTITRLLDMDIEPFLIASSLSGVISQRLVRKLCPDCSHEDTPTAGEQALFARHGMEISSIRRPKGCPSCNFKGYAGRVGIFEILPVTKEIQNLIAEHGSIAELEAQARSLGTRTLLEAGLEKVKMGVTTLEEVLKVASE